jgi:endonuclease G
MKFNPYCTLLLAALTFAGCHHRSHRHGDHNADAPASPTSAFLSTPSADTRQGYTPDDGLTAILPATRHDLPEQLLVRKAYLCSFNRQTLMPNWVAWRLTAAHTRGRLSREGVKFQEDEDVAPQYRVSTYDYNRSGYDRGHMCPAGDNKWDATALQQCFLMTNICPQGHNLNSGDWNDLEMQCRDWAEQYGEVYIICGPLLRGNRQRRIGREHRVTVPDAFFKVVVCLKGTPKGIGFVFENQDGNHPMDYYARSIDEVERLTGYDFLAALPDATERRVEQQRDLRAW